MVCKDQIFCLAKKTSCVSPILQETTTKSQRQSQRQSLRWSPRHAQRKYMMMIVSDCLMLQYIFKCICTPFHHQFNQFASRNTNAMVPVLIPWEQPNLMSTIASGIAKASHLAISTPGSVEYAIHTRTAVPNQHARIVHLDQWQIAV